jgi:hypothetical protein
MCEYMAQNTGLTEVLNVSQKSKNPVKTVVTYSFVGFVARLNPMATATIEAISTIPVIPVRGQRYLSVNVGVVPLSSVVKAASELGFTTNLVRISYRLGTELHVLLWQGSIADTPSDLDERIDRLADIVDPSTIRHCWNQGKIMPKIVKNPNYTVKNPNYTVKNPNYTVKNPI